MKNNNTPRASAQHEKKSPTPPREETPTKATSKRAQAQPDYFLTSQKRVVRDLATENIRIQPKRFLSGQKVKNWRLAHKWSAEKLAGELAYGRSYIKSIEGGSLPASQKFIERFQELITRTTGRTFPTDTPEVTARVRFKLPKSFEIQAKPVRCRKCRKWFVPHTTQQIFCSDTCRKSFRRKPKPSKRTRSTQQGRAMPTRKRTPTKTTKAKRTKSKR